MSSIPSQKFSAAAFLYSCADCCRGYQSVPKPREFPLFARFPILHFLVESCTTNRVPPLGNRFMLLAACRFAFAFAIAAAICAASTALREHIGVSWRASPRPTTTEVNWLPGFVRDKP
jgi:hypothetical protein